MLSVFFLSAVYNGLRSCILTAFFQTMHLWFEFKEKNIPKVNDRANTGSFCLW